MTEQKDIEPYEDFLGDITDQFARKDQEKEFLDSIRHEMQKRDVLVNVGERTREVREKQGLSL